MPTPDVVLARKLYSSDAGRVILGSFLAVESAVDYGSFHALLVFWHAEFNGARHYTLQVVYQAQTYIIVLFVCHRMIASIAFCK